MDGLALGFVFMTGDAGGGIGLRIEWNRMLRSGGGTSKYGEREKTPERA